MKTMAPGQILHKHLPENDLEILSSSGTRIALFCFAFPGLALAPLPIAKRFEIVSLEKRS
jgi:hypothetical protein